MDFEKPWSIFAIESEFDVFGANRIVREHNYQVSTLKRERDDLLAALKNAADQLDKLGHEWQAGMAYNHIAKVEIGEAE